MQIISRLSQGPPLTGQKTVPTGTAEAIGSGVVGEVLVKIHAENTSPVYLGGSVDVTVPGGAAPGLQGSPGDIFTFDVSNLDQVCVISTTAGQGVSYWGKKIL